MIMRRAAAMLSLGLGLGWAVGLGAADAAGVYAELEELPLDADGHLKDHMAVFPESCAEVAATAGTELRPAGVVKGALAAALGLGGGSGCTEMACLEKGTRADLLPHWFTTHDLGTKPLGTVLRECNKFEVGFVSQYEDQELVLNWVHPTTKEETRNGKLKYGEKSIHWIVSYLGHEFAVRTAEGELLATHRMLHTGVYVTGENDSKVGTKAVTAAAFENTFRNEWRRHDRVQKHYSPLGFGRGKLPPDVWASVGAYYHNNVDSFVREQWDLGGGVFVNWWEADVDILIPPWKLKRRWQAMLMPMVQRWFNSEPLEPTDIYGLRKYNNGSRLIMHVDREKTHALSMIINVDQRNMVEDWHVEINNHFDETHNIPMQPGDVVYYESAACLHGRMRPLMGDHYVNLFVHYRPVGDDAWFDKPGGIEADQKIENSPEKFYDMRSVDDLYNLWKNMGMASAEEAAAAARGAAAATASIGSSEL